MTQNMQRIKRIHPLSKSNKFKKIAFKATVLTSSLMLFGFATAAYVVDGGNATATVAMQPANVATGSGITASFSSLLTSFQTSMTKMDTELALSFKIENQNIIDAIKVLTKQSSVSANLLGENAVQNAQTEASILQADKQKDRFLKSMDTYGSAGQGYKVCTVLAEREQIEETVKGNKDSIPSTTTNTVYATAGSYGSPHDTQQAMNLNHSSKYCTSEQASSGYCDKTTDEAGWDIMMSTLFTPTTEGSTVYDAQNALINNMVGLPDIESPKAAQGTPSASQYLSAKQNKDAIISPAIYSLKSIQAEFNGMSTTDAQGKIIPILAINDQVKRYLGGGKEYNDWNKVLIGASEHGLMKEILQIQALQLYLKARQYHQGEREEMLLAGIVAATQKNLAKKNGGGGNSNLSESDQKKLELSARESKVKFLKAQMGNMK